LRLLGSRLDRAIRHGQDEQSVGIPIGPDTSLVVAEIVLTAIDLALGKAFRTNGFRFVDDYEFGFSSRAEAEDALAILQGSLAEFELQLNPLKTRIVDLPTFLEKPWASELRALEIRSTPRSQHFDLIRFFDRAFELATDSPSEAVLNYAVSRLGSLTVDATNWPLLQGLLLQAISTEPGVLRFALRQFKRYMDAGTSVDRESLGVALHGVIRDHAPRGHGSEVAWALWGLILCGLNLDDDALAAASRINDATVALLALDLRNKGRASKGVSVTQWEEAMTEDDLVGRLWLLSYEAGMKGWLPPARGSDHIKGEPSFAHLRSVGISFYDEEAWRTTEEPTPGHYLSKGQESKGEATPSGYLTS
jgi:hypothetical protein